MRPIRPRKLAKKWDIDPSTLWRWRKRQGFPRPYQLGPNVVVFDEDEADAWAKQQQVVAEPVEVAS